MEQVNVTRPMRIMLLIVGIVFGVIFLFKLAVGWFMHRAMLQSAHAAMTVSATKVDYATWQPSMRAVGSLRAVNGVNITTELSGMVEGVYLHPGSTVKKGTLLVQLNIAAEQGKLSALKASAELSDLTYQRDRAQYMIGGVSQQTLDVDRQTLKNLAGQVAEEVATVHKKTIRAPFTGRLGISRINVGQYLNAGDSITMLQALDPLYVDFFIPQQYYRQLRVGQRVVVMTHEVTPQRTTGVVSTINPAADPVTRNVEVEATIANPDQQLLPGTFVEVTLNRGQAQRYLTLPQTAISFNPYGSIVYVLRETPDKQHGQSVFKVKQVFVETGATRGEQIAILSGLKVGDTVVTSGQLKLTNSSLVTVDNVLAPPNEALPVLPNEH